MVNGLEWSIRRSVSSEKRPWVSMTSDFLLIGEVGGENQVKGQRSSAVALFVQKYFKDKI